MQRIVSNGLVAVGNGQPAVGARLFAIVIAADHTEIHGNGFRCTVTIGNGESRPGFRSGVGTHVHITGLVNRNIGNLRVDKGNRNVAQALTLVVDS